ncbi:unnamed protein product [Auanema sp. JU1783]|nr:unnamed protein product [Auanema sp. JU1783]
MALGVEDLRKLNIDQLIAEFINLQEEYEDFKNNSKEIEVLLEKEAEYAKKEAREKDNKLHMVQTELDRLKDKYDSEKAEVLKIEDSLRKQLKSAEEERNIGRIKIRELEQRNDDLERGERNNQQVMDDNLLRLNEATERITLLENEISDRQQASEEMYRLREELKERPRLVVGPLRMERCEETPEEPTPEGKKSVNIAEGVQEEDGMIVDEQLPPAVDYVKNEPAPNKQLDPALNGGKGFASCVNKIVRDLMVKVDRLEGILTGLNPISPR